MVEGRVYGSSGIDQSGQTIVQSAFYWSASTNANNPTNAWNVNFNNGNVNNNNKDNNQHAWCVRGEQDAFALFV